MAEWVKEQIWLRLMSAATGSLDATVCGSFGVRT